MATPNGLNRYDGFNFVVYKNIRSDSTSLPANVVQTIFEDHNKNLLIGTEHGLCLYVRENDCFFNYMFEKTSPLRGLDCGVAKITEDASGNLWLATNIGLIYFDRTNNLVKQYSYEADKPESLSNNDVQSVLIDKTKRLWVATRNGLNLFIPANNQFMHIHNDLTYNEDLSNTIFLDMAEDREGNIWFASNEGLFCLDYDATLKVNGLVHFKHQINNESSISIDLVLSLLVDHSGKLWVGTDNGGLNLFDSKNGSFRHYRRDDTDSQSLNNEAIQAIYEDRTGNLWIGTYTGGINIARNSGDALIRYQYIPGSSGSLSHNTVTCFLEDRKGKIWIGTDGGGLNLFDRNTNHFTRFNIDNSNLPSNAILCMIEDSSDRMWIGTWSGGLVRFDKETRSFISINTKNSAIKDDNIYAIAEGDKDDLWLGTFEHGLIHYQINENKFTEYTPSNSGLANEMVIKIVKDTKGQLIIGTTISLQVFSPRTDQFKTYTTLQDNVNSLSFPRVTDILIENDTSIWIGTPDGLNCFNPVKNIFKRYYKKDGLPDDFIMAITLDNSGVIWVTTNNGAGYFDHKRGKFKNFTKDDGLQSNEFSERGILKTTKGELFMGGTRGFNIVFPDRITENKTIPEIVITDFKLFNNSLKPGKNSLLKQNISESKSLTLTHKQSVITFSFAVMDFSVPKKNQYAYMMENFDKDWIFSGNRGEVSYTNLDPGNYVFRVRGSNNDGVWNETGTSIKITILPPWWNTWWFRLIMIVSLVLLITSIFLIRIRQLKIQKILLEKTVEHKTLELKELNASKDKFFSIIAHDLKNPFSTIIGFAEMLDEDKSLEPGGKPKEYAHMIHSSAVRTFRLLENLLEWAASQRGNITFNPAKMNLSDLIKEEIHVLNDMAVEKNIELKDTSQDDIIVYADINMLKTVLRNLISNAIKFTHRNGKVEISAVQSEVNTEISVSDNGIGMKNETLLKLFMIDANLSTRGTADEKGTGLGLLLCKEFVEKHGGKIWAESEIGKGSSFKFVFPVRVI